MSKETGILDMGQALTKIKEMIDEEHAGIEGIVAFAMVLISDEGSIEVVDHFKEEGDNFMVDLELAHGLGNILTNLEANMTPKADSVVQQMLHQIATKGIDSLGDDPTDLGISKKDLH